MGSDETTDIISPINIDLLSATTSRWKDVIYFPKNIHREGCAVPGDDLN